MNKLKNTLLGLLISPIILSGACNKKEISRKQYLESKVKTTYLDDSNIKDDGTGYAAYYYVEVDLDTGKPAEFLIVTSYGKYQENIWERNYSTMVLVERDFKEGIDEIYDCGNQPTELICNNLFGKNPYITQIDGKLFFSENMRPEDATLQYAYFNDIFLKFKEDNNVEKIKNSLKYNLSMF